MDTRYVVLKNNQQAAIDKNMLLWLAVFQLVKSFLLNNPVN